MSDAETALEMNLRYLNAQREHVLAAFDGLPDRRWSQSALPSGWTPAGLIHHLTFDVEMWWFGAIVAGDESILTKVVEGGGWTPPDLEPADLLERYREASRSADDIVRGVGLESDLAWWPPDTPRHRHNVGDVLLHVIVETAAHAGHADAAAELMDGRQWLVLT